jgi:dCTP deaminase
MGILSDAEIVDFMKKGRLTIENFNKDNITPNGYDLTIEEALVDNATIKEGTVEIAPLKWFAVSTKEYFKIGDELAAQLWLRTSWARKGILASFGKVDAGFEGTLTLSAFNASNKVVILRMGDRFAQIVFETMNQKPNRSYGERSGRYLKQRGVTLESPDRKRNEP